VSTHYGNVFSDGTRQTFGAHRRFVALVDVLGMKSWVAKVGPEAPAAELDELTKVARLAASGKDVRADGTEVPFGPLIGAALLSDSVLAYSVDDSWASLAVMGQFLHMLVRVALDQGIPMRGAMSVGRVVIDRSRGIFVGAPISDAYVSDQKHDYRGVGVHVTACARASLTDRLKVEQPELHFLQAFSPALFQGAQARGEDFLWFGNSLFVDHWGAEYLAGNSDLERCHEATALLEARWGHRGLPEDDSTRAKLEQTRQFLRDRFRQRSEGRQGIDLPPALRFAGRQKDYERLNAIGLRDIDAVAK
jgi:hypothetical protein